MVLNVRQTPQLSQSVETDGAVSLRRKRSGDRARGRSAPVLRTQEEIEKIRAAGMVVDNALAQAEKACAPGVCSHDLDEIVRETIAKAGADALFLDYPSYVPGKGFPGAACVSVNDAVIHGVPGQEKLEFGDIVSIDCGVRLDGWCADGARTVAVGTPSQEHQNLITTTKQLLDFAIEKIRPGVRWSTIAAAMDEFAWEAGYGVVAEYVGHGIGRQLHEAPSAPAVMTRSLDGRGDFTLRPGMVLAVEPMLVAIDDDVRDESGERRAFRVQTTVAADGWTVRTQSGALASHFEHTIAVTRAGSFVLTGGEESALQRNESEAMRG